MLVYGTNNGHIGAFQGEAPSAKRARGRTLLGKESIIDSVCGMYEIVYFRPYI